MELFSRGKEKLAGTLVKLPIIKSVWRTIRFHRTINESLSHHHNELDPAESKNTSLPKDEKIEIQSIWITEMYPPSKIDALVGSLKRLGWDKADGRLQRGNDLVDWIKKSRSLGNRNSWNNAGVVLRAGDNRFSYSDVRRAKLPEGIDYGYISLRTVTSSLTLLTIQFVLKDFAAESLNELFSRPYKTRVKFYPSRWRTRSASYETVSGQKSDAIERQLGKIHSSLESWFGHNLPGYYSSLNDKTAFPIIDLITSRTHKPPTKTVPQANHIDVLFYTHQEIWHGVDNKSLEFRLQFGYKDESRGVLFGNYNKLTKGIGSYGGKNRAGLANALHQTFDGTVAIWATHNLLISYEMQLSQIRDKASLSIKHSTSAIKDLSTVRQQYLSVATDAQAVGKSLNKLVKAKRFYKTDVLDFTPPFYMKEHWPNLAEMLRSQDEQRSENLVSEENDVREAVISSGNLSSAIANLRIQRSVFWLTIIIAVFTLVSIILTVRSNHDTRSIPTHGINNR